MVFVLKVKVSLKTEWLKFENPKKKKLGALEELSL